MIVKVWMKWRRKVGVRTNWVESCKKVYNQNCNNWMESLARSTHVLLVYFLVQRCSDDGPCFDVPLWYPGVSSYHLRFSVFDVCFLFCLHFSGGCTCSGFFRDIWHLKANESKTKNSWVRKFLLLNHRVRIPGIHRRRSDGEWSL